MPPDPHAAPPRAPGMVAAAHPLAAAAGARVLSGGGNAADAAVAAAAVLAVVDPANCGLGGYGGFAVVQPAGGAAMQVGFNATVSRAQQAEGMRRDAPGAQVTPPAVVAGLCALQERFGALPASSAWSQAIALARDGFAVGAGLAHALRWAQGNHPGLNAAFRATFLPAGVPLAQGAMLRQPRLAETLERIAAEGADAFRGGALVGASVATANAAGGRLDAGDFRALEAKVAPAVAGNYGRARAWSADPAECGSAVLLEGLRHLDGVDLGQARGRRYVGALCAALAEAWKRRWAGYRPLAPAQGQTTHLCAADASGMLVSMTFTHGPVWFGSGLMAGEAGVLLNCGSQLHVRRERDGTIVAQPHLAPTILELGDARYALGTPGGTRIPAIVLQAVVDLERYGVPVARLWEGARLAANADGTLEAEPALAREFPDLALRTLGTADFYGPSGALEWTARGTRAGIDPRFVDATALAAGKAVTA